MNLVLVHDWVITIGGAERCLEVFHELWPQAPLYTLVYAEESVRRLGFEPAQVHASFLQRFPRAQKWYRKYLPFYPLAIEQVDLSGYDVILSSSHAAAKGVLVRSDQLHICYCHTPVRYAWDLTHRYLKENGLERGLKSFLARSILHYIRLWDALAASRVDHFIANSRYTARRVWRCYRREATVIYPPVEVDRFRVNEKKENFFLFVSRLVPYKKADLVVAAFNRLGLPLVVVGDGPQFEACRKVAGKNVEFLGYQNDAAVADLMARTRALVFAAEEDFGIVPVEAQACGTPVIAYGKGGVEDTVVSATGDNWEVATGIFFHEQSVEALETAVRQFLDWEGLFRPVVMRRNAERFGWERFKKEIATFVFEKWVEFSAGKKV
ncbi:glycosyltransferase [Desulfofundulus thermobenzoicus]|uniref:Glycosyltransferase n=1 Tax=Desulfofundulus thermobenzoicus TaxID=29376 RepID=A0A6N7IQA6_9FIRM|nr:glycosyltransferase [Desulfofundulus thermobenzoicus]MQL52255.1 glycosyltransferase [Desulfofundulus thermobenzoicus]